MVNIKKIRNYSVKLNMYFSFLAFIFSLIFHLLSIIKLYIPPKFIIYILNIGFIVSLFLTIPIYYISIYINPEFEYIYKKIIPYDNIRPYQFFFYYSPIILICFSKGKLSVIGSSTHDIISISAVWLLFYSITIEWYYSFSQIIYIKNVNKNINEGIILKDWILFYNKSSNIRTKDQKIIYHNKDYINSNEAYKIIYYLFIIFIILSIIKFQRNSIISNNKLILSILIGLIISYVVFLVKKISRIKSQNTYIFDLEKQAILFEKKVIHFKDIDYIKIQIIENIEYGGVNDYIFSIIFNKINRLKLLHTENYKLLKRDADKLSKLLKKKLVVYPDSMEDYL